MQKIRKFLISALTAVLFVALTVSAVFLFPRKVENAYAARGSNFNVIEEIWQGGNKPFNGENMGKLFTALTGKKNATIKDVESLLANDTDGNGDNTTVASDYFRSLKYSDNGVENFTDGYNISVNFAGKKWDVVSLVKARDTYSDGSPNVDNAGSITLTLWQSADNVTQISEWANRAVDDTTANYPSNMYSTSIIRVETLNNGGYISESGDALIKESGVDKLYTPKTTEAENTYARFTSSQAENSVVGYLVKPKEIAYQETENNNGNSSQEYSLVNDAYGTDTSKYQSTVNFYKDDFKNYTTKDHYGDWQNDYLWLPSLAETGNSDTANQNGLWKTDVALRSTVITGGKSYAWLRSGYYYYSTSYAYLPDASGNGNYALAGEYVVRPALHLNLTAAGAASMVTPTKPTSDQLLKTETFDGAAKTFALPNLGDVTYTPQDDNGWWNSETRTITATNAGEYKVEVTPPEDGWKDGTKNAITFTLKIKKATIGEDWSGFSKSQDYVYHADGNKIALKLPDVTDGSFPLSLVGKDTLSAGDITVEYIIDIHEEGGHDAKKAEIEGKIEKANGGDPSGLNAIGSWTAYVKDGKCGDQDFDVSKPLGYCVIFKAEDPEGNHETLYGYFSVHIYNEKLTIKLTKPADLAEVEYGEVAHTQSSLREKIFADIPDKEGIVVLDDDGSVKEDRTTEFKAEAQKEKFIFYYSDGSNTYDIADDDDGTRLEAGKTYYLYVKYVGEAGVDGSANYITFEWEGGRPSFKVTPREIDLDLNVTGSHKYNETPPTVWATATPKRATGKSGEWYGKTADNNVTNLKLKYKFKKSDGTGEEYTALSKDMPAGTYNITVESGNDNYVIKATTPTVPTYTVGKGEYSITFGDLNEEYTGEEISHEISSLPKGVSATYTYEGTDGTSYENSATAPTNAGKYTVTATFTTTDDNYNAPAAKTATLTIEPKELYFSLKNSSGEYTGEEHDGIDVDFETLAIGDSLTKGVDYDLKFEVDGEGALGSGNLPQDKGTYKVTVTLKDTVKNYKMADGAEATYSITLGGLAKPTGDDIDETYKGDYYELKLTGFDKDTMSYSTTGDGAEFDEDTGVFSATNAGTYTLDVTIRNTDEYQWTGDGKTRFTITINKKQLTVTANDNTVTYGEEPAGAGVEFDGFASGESVSNLSGTLDYDFDYTQGGDVGDGYKITPKGYVSDNYDIEFADGTLKVTPKSITLKINDGGHMHGGTPQSKFTLTDVNGELVAGDTTAVFDGLITFYIKSGGSVVALDSSLAVGEYELCADDGNYGNYTVTFTAGKYIVSNDSITAPTADPNADNFVYTGDELTYMPEGFDPLTMDFEGNENVQTDAGEYTVKVYPKNRELVFETADGPKDHLEFKFVIKPAEIVELNDNGNSFIQDEVTGGGETPYAVTLGKKKNGKFANFDTVADQDITIYATLPMSYDGGDNKPARPEFALGDYIDITELDIDDPDYPLNVDVKTVGKYVVYYHIVAPNHEDLDGEWRVEVAKDSEVVKVVFKKAYEIPYGVTPDPEDIFEDIKAMPAQYLSVTKGGEDFTSTFFNDIAQGVSLGCRRINEFGKYSDSGEYYINFKLAENSVYTVIYREGGNNPEDDTNFDKLKITQRELALIWDTSKLSYTFTGDAITLDGLATLDGAMADDWDGMLVRFELSDHNQVITAEGEYQVTAVLVGANARNYRFSDEARVVNTVVVTAAPSQENENDDGGIPWWVWLIVGLGVALIITAIIIVVVVMKKKKAKDDTVEAVQTPAPAPEPAAAETKVIYRDINSDDDGFYDDVTNAKNDDED